MNALIHSLSFTMSQYLIPHPFINSHTHAHILETSHTLSPQKKHGFTELHERTKNRLGPIMRR